MHLFRAPFLCPSGGINSGTRESDDTFAEIMEERRSTRKGTTVKRSIGRISTRFGEGGGQLYRRRATGALGLCAREPQARPWRFLRGKLISDHSLFSLCESRQGVAIRQEFCGFLQGCLGLWTGRCWRARRLYGSRPPPPWASVQHFSLFFCMTWP